MSDSVWRLLLDGENSGAWNMAVDETLWRSAAKDGVSTLRFYSWQPHCLSVGRLQKQLPDAALEASREFDLVRRPTGGRAVWHAQEITYSLAVPLETLPREARSVNGAYEWLSRGFLTGLQSLGVPVEMAPSGVRAQGPNCFAASAGCDFLVNGKKLIGAAQCRDDQAILQHGSILLSINQSEWQNFAGGPMNSAVSLRELGFEHSRKEIIDALVAGFEATTGQKTARGALDEIQIEAARGLESGKYGSERWTLKAEMVP